MPPKGRGKSAKRPKPRQQTGSFGELELDTPPASRQLRSSQARKLSPAEQAKDGFGTGSAFCANVNASPAEPESPLEEFDNGVDDNDLIQLDYSILDNTQTQPVPDINWSEVGSLTRRSSPLRVADVGQEIWEFGEKDSINPFSSPRPGVGMLPDTMPLPPIPPFETKTQSQGVDFSETASTMRRSSPLAVLDSMPDLWQFQENSSPQRGLAGSLPMTREPRAARSSPPASSPVHLPIDEMYDATPPGSQAKKTTSALLPLAGAHILQQRFRDPTPPQTSQKEVSTKVTRAKKGKKGMKDLLAVEFPSDDDEPTPCPGKAKPLKDEHGLPTTLDEHDLPDTVPLAHDSPTAPQEMVRSKKRKQRAKTPIQFDEATQEIKEIPRKKKSSALPRLTIVSALKAAAKTSVSPVTSAKKRPAPKAASRLEAPKKKRKGPTGKAKRTEPPTANASTVAGTVHPRDAKLKRPTKREIEDEDQDHEAMDIGPIVLEEEPQEAKTLPIAPELIVLSSDTENSELSELEASPPSQPVPPKKSGEKKQDQLVKRNGGSPLENRATSHNVLLGHEQVSPPRSKNANLSVKVRLSHSCEQGRGNSQEVGATKVPKAVKRTIGSMKKDFTKATGEANVLAPRDPNRAPKRTLRSPQHKALQKAKDLERPEVAQSQTLRKAGKLSRSYSISEAGSPVPVGSDHARLMDNSPPWDRHIPDPSKD
ncbi:hypothetical protein QQZ08_003595 [Neonectria magnoliae]|uniref:Uncharacterized protein n=1 Tax=Neonectria magnoliae TaxID=2732573 RepID=A0ABR1I8Q8_9HYPO